MNFCTITICMADSSSMFTFTAAICGFHIYHHSWTPHIGQQLPTEQETDDNLEDRFAIAVVDMIGSSCSFSTHFSGMLTPAAQLCFYIHAHAPYVSMLVEQRSPTT